MKSPLTPRRALIAGVCAAAVAVPSLALAGAYDPEPPPPVQPQPPAAQPQPPAAQPQPPAAQPQPPATQPQPPASPRKPPATRPAPVVAFVVKGTVASKARGRVVVAVVKAGTNPPGRLAVGRLLKVTVKLGPRTKITKVRVRRATLASLRVGDRVTVTWRARRGTLARALPAAASVRSTGPAPRRGTRTTR